MLAHLGLVKQIAGKLKKRLPAHVNVDELESAGAIGLLQSAVAWDASRGIAFGAFARRRIVGSMLDHLRGNDPLTRLDRRRVNRGERHFFEVQLHDDHPELINQEPADPLPWPDETAARMLQAQHVRRTVDRLPPRERHVIEQHFYRGRNLAEIAVDLRVGEARTSQLKQQAIGRMRRWLAQ